MNKRPGYSPEVRERAVCLVLTDEHVERFKTLERGRHDYRSADRVAKKRCGAEQLIYQAGGAVETEVTWTESAQIDDR